MTWIQSLIYGFLSGISDIFPVSMQAHQSLILQIFGLSNRQPICDLLVHIAILLSVYAACNPSISRLRRDMKLLESSRRRRKQMFDMRGLYEVRLLKGAIAPMIVGILIYLATDKLEANLIYLALFFLINGVILFVPEHMRHGNKDARSMSGLDSLLLGLSGVLSAFPGISRVGVVISIGSARGADRQHALNWALLLSLPALILLCLYDIILMFTVGIGGFTFLSFLWSLLCAVGAFCGSYFAISVMRYLTVRVGYSAFAYYSWGAALFSFILYLIT